MNKPKFLRKPNVRISRIVPLLVVMILFAHAYHVVAEFFETNRLQVPFVIETRPVVTTRYVSPIPDTKIQVIPLEPEAKPVPSISPSPTPQKKSMGVVKQVEASASYPYQDKILFMDEGQKEVMHRVEEVLGFGYAELIFRESGFHPLSVNHIGACGLGQANPCSKLPCELEDVDCQLEWIKSYTEGRYGSIDKALSFHDEKGWY